MLTEAHEELGTAPSESVDIHSPWDKAALKHCTHHTTLTLEVTFVRPTRGERMNHKRGPQRMDID